MKDDRNALLRSALVRGAVAIVLMLVSTFGLLFNVCQVPAAPSGWGLINPGAWLTYGTQYASYSTCLTAIGLVSGVIFFIGIITLLLALWKFAQWAWSR